MKKLFEVFKITMSIAEARINFIICVAGCIAAFVICEVGSSGSALYTVALAILSMSCVSTAAKYGQYFSAVLQKQKDAEDSGK